MANEADSKNVPVEDYYDKVHRTTWTRRTAGTFAGATIGGVCGAIIGAVAAYLPYVLSAMNVAGAATAVALPGIFVAGGVVATAAVFAGAGALLGVAGVGLVGASSAAVATGLAEKEIREKKEAGLSVSGNKTVSKEPIPKLLSWKVALFTVPLTAAFGALLGFSPINASSAAKMGFEAGSHAAIAASAAVFSMFGVVFATKMSYITNKVSNFYMDIFTEDFFKKAPQQEVTVQKNKSEDVMPPIEEPQREGKSFAANKVRFSLQGLIEKSEERSTNSDVSMTR